MKVVAGTFALAACALPLRSASAVDLSLPGGGRICDTCGGGLLGGSHPPPIVPVVPPAVVNSLPLPPQLKQAYSQLNNAQQDVQKEIVKQGNETIVHIVKTGGDSLVALTNASEAIITTTQKAGADTVSTVVKAGNDVTVVYVKGWRDTAAQTNPSYSPHSWDSAACVA